MWKLLSFLWLLDALAWEIDLSGWLAWAFAPVVLLVGCWWALLFLDT